jgi:hypothetical protein
VMSKIQHDIRSMVSSNENEINAYALEMKSKVNVHTPDAPMSMQWIGLSILMAILFF